MSAAVAAVQIETPEAPPGAAVVPAPNAPLAVAPASPTTMVADSATELLRIAVERGTPLAELKELVALHDQMSKREAARAFSGAMARFQAELEPIQKPRTAKVATKSGGSYEFTYAGLGDIAKVITPLLAKHGLSFNWDATEEAGRLHCVCTVRHEGGHSVSASLGIPVDNASGMSPQQKVGAALTFAQRRTLSSVLGITTTDDEPEAAHEDPALIDDDQYDRLDHLLEETKADRARFLEYVGAATLAEIRAADYPRALAALRQKKAKR